MHRHSLQDPAAGSISHSAAFLAIAIPSHRVQVLADHQRPEREGALVARVHGYGDGVNLAGTHDQPLRDAEGFTLEGRRVGARRLDGEVEDILIMALSV